ncbi:MAG: DUF4340 domain-containing protein [Spirochaetaceae bacterium]|nr:DUF4340 domain-containing protein [Spirochaetaceae bacterium]
MTNKLSVRKIILLSLIAVLLVVYILQLVISGANDGYSLVLKESPDTILIQNGIKSQIKIVNSNGIWLLKEGSENPEENYAILPANTETVNQMVTSLSKIEVLGLVSRNADNERFGFTENESVKIICSKEGKILRTLELGKNSSTYQQVYAKVDESNNVVLVSGNPKTLFDVTFENLKAPVKTDSENSVGNSTTE